MPALRTRSLVLMLALGLLGGPAMADIRLPLTKPDDTTTPAAPNPAMPEPPIPEPPKPIPEMPEPPATGTPTVPTGLVVAGGFLSLAIAGFGLVILRSRRRSAKTLGETASIESLS